jgi:hypothetical protein
MRPPRAVAVALLLSLVVSTSAFAAEPCGGRSGWEDPCLEDYYARYCADDCYTDDDSNPFRVAAYIIHPIGVALEWGIFRWLHLAVSQPSTAPIFGHTCEYTE